MTPNHGFDARAPSPRELPSECRSSSNAARTRLALSTGLRERRIAWRTTSRLRETRRATAWFLVAQKRRLMNQEPRDRRQCRRRVLVSRSRRSAARECFPALKRAPTGQVGYGRLPKAIPTFGRQILAASAPLWNSRRATLEATRHTVMAVATLFSPGRRKRRDTKPVNCMLAETALADVLAPAGAREASRDALVNRQKPRLLQ